MPKIGDCGNQNGVKEESERQIIITRDGKPTAIMIGVDGDTVESSLREIRRAILPRFPRFLSRLSNIIVDPGAGEGS